MAQHPVILVAEDEPIVAHDLCDTVEAAGFIVEGPFDDATSAWQAFEKQKPDLAILDINLHGGTAYSLAEKMMAQDVPVIFHSGEVASEEVQALYPKASALSKPCPPGKILDTVQQALEGA
jgi:two-component system, response regulator PdtaR